MLEIAVLAGAFAWIERPSRDWERLTVAGDRVFVERTIGGQFSMREWNRAWLRVEVAETGVGGATAHRGSSATATRGSCCATPARRSNSARALPRRRAGARGAVVATADRAMVAT